MKAKALTPSILLKLRLHQRLQLDRRALALVPRLQQHAGDAVLRPLMPFSDKAQIGFRETGKHLVELLAVEIQVVDIGVFRRLGHREHDALIFLGRQLLRGVHVEEADQPEDGRARTAR